MTSTIHDEFDSLERALEARFQSHTDRLISLTEAILTGDGGSGAYDRDTAASIAAMSRRELAEISDALRRLAEGRYGTCDRCRVTIRLERLAARPTARFCVACERIESRAVSGVAAARSAPARELGGATAVAGRAAGGGRLGMPHGTLARSVPRRRREPRRVMSAGS